MQWRRRVAGLGVTNVYWYLGVEDPSEARRRAVLDCLKVKVKVDKGLETGNVRVWGFGV